MSSQSESVDGGLSPGLTAIMGERRQLINLAYRLLGSLADGRYSLLVRANLVSAGGQQLDGDGDGQGGDDFTVNGSAGNGFYRLFGDANGDGVVNAFEVPAPPDGDKLPA